MMNDRDLRVVKAANEVIDNCVSRMPTEMFGVCRYFGIELITATEYISCGMTADDLFGAWGNRDGFAVSRGKHHTINYNDRAAPKRARFTMAEELMHILLGHTRDQRFYTLDPKYDDQIYEQYENEARNGAGMVLVPPVLYYKYRQIYTKTQLARLFDVSEACMWKVAQYYEANEAELSDLTTHRYIMCDTAGLRPKLNYRPINIWPEDGIL